MDIQSGLDVVFRWVHVWATVVLVGGSVFIRFVLMPAASKLPDAEHDALRERLMSGWKKMIHAGIGLLLVSGFYNFARTSSGYELDKSYHALIGIKMLLAFAVFFIASALAGRSAAFAPIRNNAKKWLAINILLAAVIVGIGSYLKVKSPKSRKAEEKEQAVQHQTTPSPSLSRIDATGSSTASAE